MNSVGHGLVEYMTSHGLTSKIIFTFNLICIALIFCLFQLQTLQNQTDRDLKEQTKSNICNETDAPISPVLQRSSEPNTIKKSTELFLGCLTKVGMDTLLERWTKVWNGSWKKACFVLFLRLFWRFWVKTVEKTRWKHYFSDDVDLKSCF